MSLPIYIVARISGGATTELDRTAGDLALAHDIARRESRRYQPSQGPVYVCREEGVTMVLVAAYENGHRLMYSGETK